MREILVMDIMTRDPVAISPNENIIECAKKMIKNNVGSLLVVEKKKLVGFLSHQDILKALIKYSKKELLKVNAKQIASKNVITISPNSTLKDAIEKMKKYGYERLPVVQKNLEYVGLITSKDILNFNPEFYEEFKEIDKIREIEEKANRIKGIGSREIQGICEECGSREYLNYVNGVFLCESCREEIQ